MRFKRAVQLYGQTPEPDTPYQRAGQLWDERIGSARVHAKNWRLMAFGGLGLTNGLSSALVWQSLPSRVVPYVLDVDKLAQAQAVTQAAADYRSPAPQPAWHVGRFNTPVMARRVAPVMHPHPWARA